MSEKQISGEFCWTELVSPDLKTAKTFYAELLGWSFTDVTMEEGSYTMVKKENREIGGMWEIPNDKRDQIPPHWMSYILVRNIKETFERAIKLGATELRPITPAGDLGLFAIVKDPTGAAIAFWQAIDLR